eukprot:9368222-Ditylum_brightwellii.AAC.1
MGDDLIPQVEEYKKSLCDEKFEKIPNNFSPRSVRPTVRWWKRDDVSLEAANNDSTSAQLTFTQPRRSTKKQQSKDDVHQRKQQHQVSSQPNENKPKKQIDLESLDILTIDQ